jgi:hypothetical protein
MYYIFLSMDSSLWKEAKKAMRLDHFKVVLLCCNDIQ